MLRLLFPQQQEEGKELGEHTETRPLTAARTAPPAGRNIWKGETACVPAENLA